MLDPLPEVHLADHRAWCRHLKKLGQLSHQHRACTETLRCVAGSIGHEASEQPWRYRRGQG